MGGFDVGMVYYDGFEGGFVGGLGFSVDGNLWVWVERDKVLDLWPPNHHHAVLQQKTVNHHHAVLQQKTQRELFSTERRKEKRRRERKSRMKMRGKNKKKKQTIYTRC